MNTALLKLTDSIYVLDICKNCSSTIKSLILGVYNRQNELHNKLFNYAIDYKIKFPVDYKVNGVKVAVWRDPVERCVSVYTDKVLNYEENTKLCRELKSANIKTFSDLLEYIKVHKTEDGHIDSQSNIIGNVELDYLIPMSLFNKWLRKETNYTPIIANRSLYIYKPTEEEIQTVKEIYKEDYSLLDRFKIYSL